MNQFIIGVGSNIEPEKNIINAREELEKISTVLKQSAFIYTKPLLFADQPDFLNGVFLIETAMNTEELNKKLKEIERRMGRIKVENKNGPRTIDLDILISNRIIISKDLMERDFLQKAVTEILPEIKF
jgi:2-amino-4-hydroxy-6-hydroxymethyldihydropteridine diphosphokinase